MFVQHTLRFTKRCHCGTKNKGTGDIFDRRKQTLHKGVYSGALEQDVGGLLGCVCWAPVLAHREEVLISLPRQICNRFLKLFSCAAVVN